MIDWKSWHGIEKWVLKKNREVVSRLSMEFRRLTHLRVKRIQASCRPRITNVHDAGNGEPNWSLIRGEIDAEGFHAAILGADLTIVNIHVLANGGGMERLCDEIQVVFESAGIIISARVVKRVSYSGYYATLPRSRGGFDSHHPLQTEHSKLQKRDYREKCFIS